MKRFQLGLLARTGGPGGRRGSCLQVFLDVLDLVTSIAWHLGSSADASGQFAEKLRTECGKMVEVQSSTRQCLNSVKIYLNKLYMAW